MIKLYKALLLLTSIINVHQKPHQENFIDHLLENEPLNGKRKLLLFFIIFIVSIIIGIIIGKCT